MTGSEIPGWHVIRVDRRSEGAGARNVSLLICPEIESEGKRLQVDVWQLPSRTEAHQFLADRLGRFEGGPPRRLESPPAGDVAFAGVNRYLVAFARGNLAICLRNAGLQLVSAEDPARALDRWLTQRPTAPPDPGQAALTAPLAEAGIASPIGFKYFADQGQLSIQDGRPVLQGAEANTMIRVPL
jgi:hypothetical protein